MHIVTLFFSLQPTAKKAKTEAAANGDRRKGVPWTEEEHRLFLLGLAKFGKGDWRSIARNYVVSRTPTQARKNSQSVLLSSPRNNWFKFVVLHMCLQVASHAQKYFIRLNSMSKKDKRRASIHDITTPGTIPDMKAQSVQPPYPMMPPGGMMPHMPNGMPHMPLPMGAPPAMPMPVMPAFMAQM